MDATSMMRAAGLPELRFYAADGKTEITARDVQDLKPGSTYFWQGGNGKMNKATRK